MYLIIALTFCVRSDCYVLNLYHFLNSCHFFNLSFGVWYCINPRWSASARDLFAGDPKAPDPCERSSRARIP